METPDKRGPARVPEGQMGIAQRFNAGWELELWRCQRYVV